MDYTLLLGCFLVFLGAHVQYAFGQCKLTKIDPMPNFKPEKVTRTWHAVRVYPSHKDAVHKDDLMVNITMKEGVSAGKRVLQYTYYQRNGSRCEQKSVDRKESKPGVYYADLFTNVRVVHTDYTNLMVEFVCNKVIGLVCTKPEVIFWSRRVPAREDDVTRLESNLTKLCVSTETYYNVHHHHDMDCISLGAASKMMSSCGLSAALLLAVIHTYIYVRH